MEFELKVFKLTSSRRETIYGGDALFTEERKKYNVEAYLDIDNLTDPDTRLKAKKNLAEYSKQLLVERNFYVEFHRTYIEEITELSQELLQDERDSFLSRCLPGLEENDSIRMGINSEKNQVIEKMLMLIDIFEFARVSNTDLHELKSPEVASQAEEAVNLITEIDEHLEQQYQLAVLQRKRGVDGQRFMQRIVNMFKYA